MLRPPPACGRRELLPCATLQVVSHCANGKGERRCGDLAKQGRELHLQRLKAILKDLGFDVQRTGSGNHYVVDHDGIPGFTGANFDCGHDKHMKPCYPRNMRKLLEKYETEITQYLEGQAK